MKIEKTGKKKISREYILLYITLAWCHSLVAIPVTQKTINTMLLRQFAPIL